MARHLMAQALGREICEDEMYPCPWHAPQPAFSPSPLLIPGVNCDPLMTLRDRFAMEILRSLQDTFYLERDRVGIAEHCYKLADEMLKAREIEPTPEPTDG